MPNDLAALQAQAEDPDTDCVGYVDDVVPALLEEIRARREAMYQIFWLNTHPQIEVICKEVYREWGGIDA